MMLSIAPLTTAVTKPTSEPYVLLVDDHEPTLSRLQTVIESAGHRCVATTSAVEALVLSDAHRPGLVVTDLSMPRLDGEGLARWLKARYPSIPMILVTGEALDGPTQSALRRVFAAVLTKPLHVDPFLAIVADLMPRSYRSPRP